MGANEAKKGDGMQVSADQLLGKNQIFSSGENEKMSFKIVRKTGTEPFKEETANAIANFIINYKADFHYIGYINSKFERELFGLNISSENDVYFGEFEKDNKSGYGAFIDRNQQNYYFGQFKYSIPNGKGLYIWKDDNDNTKELINQDFSMFCGEVKNNKPVKGITIEKREDEVVLYIGKYQEQYKANDEDYTINKELSREDDKGFLYDVTQDLIFIGKFKNDAFYTGLCFKVDFDRDLKISDIKKMEKQVIQEGSFYGDEFEQTLKKDYSNVIYRHCHGVNGDYLKGVDSYFHKVLSIMNSFTSIEDFRENEMGIFMREMTAYLDFMEEFDVEEDEKVAKEDNNQQKAA